ncbi:MAG: glycoside hydrolase family 1 protein [Actinobacteria bacterium]|nr:glycoside hydrolase family 1 protein [Actinomycetota bacterium]
MSRIEFPKGFFWGAATSAHQVEGNCTNNHWWAWEQEGLRARPPRGYVHDGTTSGVACDTFHRYDDDHRLAAGLGHNAHRISLEWSRIEPEEGRFDRAAIDHYKRVVDSMRRRGLEPFVTLHHFTNPIWAQRAGGWESAEMASWLARYAAFAARELGDRVVYWMTINEPMIAPALCYMFGIHPPCVRDLGRAVVVGRHVLLAHGEMYGAVHGAVRHRVQVAPVLQMPYFEPFDPGSDADVAAAASSDQWMNEYYFAGLRDGVVSPPFGDGAVVPGLAGSYEFIGLNYYMRVLVEAGGAASLVGKRRSTEPDRFVDEMGWEVHPDGLYRQIVRVAGLGKPVMVTENGMATLDDTARTEHLLEHLRQVGRAVAGGVDVRGYFYWSLIDNFEWAEGYSRHFGLVGVDRETLARTPRPAAETYREIIGANAVES